MKRQDVSGQNTLHTDGSGSGSTDVNITAVGGTPVTSPLPVQVAAGTAVIGHVITDTGSTTAVTGNVTVVQGTGTNLHTVVDSGVITSITNPVTVAQATAASLNATVVGTGTFAVQATIAAGTALIGQVAASNETSTIYNGATALTPKFAKIAASSNGDNTIVAAVGGKKLRVIGYNLMANGTVNVKWQSGASGTDLTGLKYLIANTGLSVAYSPVGWFETASGALLNLNLSAGIAVGGELVYLEV